MTKYYSKSASGFFDTNIYPLNKLPQDAVEISDEQHSMLIQKQSEGYVIVGRSNNQPELVTKESLMSLETIKNQRKNFINSERDRVMNEGVEYQGVLFDCDDQAKTDVTGVITGIIAGIPLPENFTWRSKENYDIPMESEDVMNLGVAIMNYRHAILKHSWELKDLIDSKTTKTDVNAITW